MTKMCTIEEELLYWKSRLCYVEYSLNKLEQEKDMIYNKQKTYNEMKNCSKMRGIPHAMYQDSSNDMMIVNFCNRVLHPVYFLS